MMQLEPKKASTSSSAAKSLLQKKGPASQQIIQSPAACIQTKLTIGSADDIYEKEADAMADQVMRMPMPGTVNFLHSSPLVNRKCAECEQEEQLQRKESNSDSMPVAPS